MQQTNFSNKCPFRGYSIVTDLIDSPVTEKLIPLNSLTDILPPELLPYQECIKTFQNWVLNFLSKPHQELGRKGAICPYTKKSYELSHFLVNVQPVWRLSPEDVKTVILKFKEKFLTLSVENEYDRIFTTVVLLFPNLLPECYDTINDIQESLKPEFVREGLMLGQFYPGCPQRGLHNAEFRPLNSPIPLLAIRHMVESDWPFLKGNPEFEISYHQIFNPAPVHQI